MSEPRPVRAPRGTSLTAAKGWPQEAALRMIQNNLDPEVAEHPDELVVYGGSGRAARNWDAFDGILRSLADLEGDETLLVQSGKPVGIFRTHEWAPRVLIANSNLVPQWATWRSSAGLESLGLTMFGQMTAGSWIYIGTQGILQGTYETFAAVAEKRFGGTLAGTITLTAGLGGMGGAQPLAVTMNGGVAICVECDPSRIERRVAHRYCDVRADSLTRRCASPGRLGTSGAPVDRGPRQRRRRRPRAAAARRPDRHRHRSDQRARPARLPAARRRVRGHGRRTRQGPGRLHRQGPRIHGRPRRGDGRLPGRGRRGVRLRQLHPRRGAARRYARAFEFPGFVPAYIRPLFCEGKGPFRWAALSGDPKDIARTDRAILDLFPDNEPLTRWIRMAGEKVHFQGLPSRICWLGYGERDKAGEAFNDLVARGEISAPIVLGRDHLDCGSVASPYRETEGMKDGSDAIADWPLLNAMLNTASGATWVSIHHGGGVGIGRSIHAARSASRTGRRSRARSCAAS